MEIKRIGSQPSGKGPADWFTGTVRIDPMFDRTDPARVSGATVTGTVLRQAKDKKILVFKYKPKKRVRKLNGHRQRFAEVRIDTIALS